jgi:phosphate transport system substrate-binding protein
MGFASFVAGDIGQRIILKSGLLPIRTRQKISFIINNKKEKKMNKLNKVKMNKLKF